MGFSTDMALGMKVLIVLFAMISIAVLVFIMQSDSSNSIMCIINPQVCMANGGMGLLGTNMMAPGLDLVGFD